MAPPLKQVPSAWRGVILVCGKCSKKLDGGFGKKARTPLAKLLRKRLGVGKGRKATLGVVETRCLGLCPRGAVALIDGRALDRWLVVPQDADVVELAARLSTVRALPADQA